MKAKKKNVVFFVLYFDTSAYIPPTSFFAGLFEQDQRRGIPKERQSSSSMCRPNQRQVSKFLDALQPLAALNGVRLPDANTDLVKEQVLPVLRCH